MPSWARPLDLHPNGLNIGPKKKTQLAKAHLIEWGGGPSKELAFPAEFGRSVIRKCAIGHPQGYNSNCLGDIPLQGALSHDIWRDLVTTTIFQWTPEAWASNSEAVRLGACWLERYMEGFLWQPHPPPKSKKRASEAELVYSRKFDRVCINGVNLGVLPTCSSA